jgi:ABC-type branched-subunit amino acid transport system substrate-binding protein
MLQLRSSLSTKVQIKELGPLREPPERRVELVLRHRECTMFSVRNRFTLGMTLVAALGLQSQGLRAAGKEIVIGVAGPHTGANAPFGLQLWKGAEAAAKDINDAGGINGKKLRVVKADDACIPAQAKSVANKLVNTEGVTAVVGHFCSSSTIPAASVYRENNVLMITPASTNPRVTEDAAFKPKVWTR